MQIYLLIADDRQGPFTPEQITEKIQAGECTAETLAWTDGMEEWKPLAEVCPQPAAPPPLPEMPAVKSVMAAGGSNAFLDFFRAYRGLFLRIKNSPLPQPAKWYDRYPVIFPAAFVAFFFLGLGLIPLLLTSRLSGGDKGRLSLIAAWPLYMAMLPVIAPLVIVVLVLLPPIVLPVMWWKKWFTPQLRNRLTTVFGGGFAALVALTIFLNVRARSEANELFKNEPEKVMALVSAAKNNVLASSSATEEAKELIRRFQHIEDVALTASLRELQTAVDSAKVKQEQAAKINQLREQWVRAEGKELRRLSRERAKLEPENEEIQLAALEADIEDEAEKIAGAVFGSSYTLGAEAAKYSEGAAKVTGIKGGRFPLVVYVSKDYMVNFSEMARIKILPDLKRFFGRIRLSSQCRQVSNVYLAYGASEFYDVHQTIKFPPPAGVIECMLPMDAIQATDWQYISNDDLAKLLDRFGHFRLY